VNPQVAIDHLDELKVVAKLLSLDIISLKEKIKRHSKREFLYLKRHAPPELADEVMALKVPGVALLNEYRRYIPVVKSRRTLSVFLISMTMVRKASSWRMTHG